MRACWVLALTSAPLVPADGGIQVPAPLDELYGLYSRELGEGLLNRLLLLQSVVASHRQVSPRGLACPLLRNLGPWPVCKAQGAPTHP